MSQDEMSDLCPSCKREPPYAGAKPYCSTFCAVVGERDEWKARAERAERERDDYQAAAEQYRTHWRQLAAAQARERELRAALASIRVTSSHVVDSPGEALWLGLGEEDLACDHFEDEARKLEFFAQATLSAPQDDSALRAFGSKVVRRVYPGPDTPAWRALDEAIVDAVLKGAE